MRQGAECADPDRAVGCIKAENGWDRQTRKLRVVNDKKGVPFGLPPTFWKSLPARFQNSRPKAAVAAELRTEVCPRGPLSPIRCFLEKASPENMIPSMGSGEKSAGPILPTGPLSVCPDQPNFRLLDLKMAASAEVTAAGAFIDARYAPVATKFGPAPKCRDGPAADTSNGRRFTAWEVCPGHPQEVSSLQRVQGQPLLRS